MFRRKPKLPDAQRPALDAGERILAWSALDGDPTEQGPGAPTGEGPVVVATNFGLLLPGQDGRIGWHEIHKASWSGRELTVVPATLVEHRDSYDVMADAPAQSYALLDAGDVPHEVRARVTRSVGYSTHHQEPGVRIVARRVPGVDGLSWAARYDTGVDAKDPAVIAATDELVAAARSTVEP